MPRQLFISTPEVWYTDIQWVSERYVCGSCCGVLAHGVCGYLCLVSTGVVGISEHPLFIDVLHETGVTCFTTIAVKSVLQVLTGVRSRG